jgi:hypothetical protein
VGGPGLDFETWVSPRKWGASPEHPGLKSETWATHSMIIRAIFIFFRWTEGPSVPRQLGYTLIMHGPLQAVFSFDGDVECRPIDGQGAWKVEGIWL